MHRSNHKNGKTSNEANGSRIKCTFSGCRKTYSSTKNLNQHVKRNHEKIQFKCEMCDKILVSSFSLKRHIRDMHKKNILSTESAQVVIGRSSIKITPKAKIALIREQTKKIAKLKAEFKMLENIKSALLQQLLAENME